MIKPPKAARPRARPRFEETAIGRKALARVREMIAKNPGIDVAEIAFQLTKAGVPRSGKQQAWSSEAARRLLHRVLETG